MIRALKQSGNTIVDDEQVEKISSKQRRNGNEAARHAFIARHAIERAAYFSSGYRGKQDYPCPLSLTTLKHR